MAAACLDGRSSRVTGAGALELGVLTNVRKEEKKLTSSQGERYSKQSPACEPMVHASNERQASSRDP